MATKKKTVRTASKSAAEYKGRALHGKAAKGKEMDPSAPMPMAAVGLVELNEPRPGKTRYPISEQEFVKLKEASHKKKLGKSTVTAAKDGGKKTELGPQALGSFDVMAAAEPAAAPTPVTNFEGIPATGWIPPDCTMATGPAHVLVSVNSSVAIYNKTGGAPVMQKTLTVWFANVVQNMTVFDPKALYDQHAGRWVLLAVGIRQNPNQSVFLLSVSNTSNPLGPWRNYVFNASLNGSTPTNNWADYPALGVDNQSLYVTANMFQFGGGFQYSKIRVIPKAGPYSGGVATYTDFFNMKNANNTVAFTIQPCHTFGVPGAEFLVNSLFPSGQSLTLWRITGPPNAPVLTRTTVQAGAYSLPPNANQMLGGAPLNTGDVRVLHAVCRGGSVWCALTTAKNWGGASNQASIHWFQINSGASNLVQQGVYGAAGFHYFYPAPTVDTNGNMIMVFSRCGATQFGSILYTGRKSTDPLGTLQASALLKAGVANYVATDGSGRNRWGDYAGVSVDPTNGRDVWVYSMFASAVNTWGTWIGSSRF